MQYRNQIPETLLSDNTQLDNFVSVLDGVEVYKTGIVEKAIRFNKAPLLMDLSWLRKKAEDLGWPPVPADFTKEQLDAMILNAEHVMALKGSKMGGVYWLWAITLGNVTVDDTDFYPQGEFIIPSDDYYGYLSHIQSLQAYDLYLFDDYVDFGTQILLIDIATKYHYQASLREYILTNIKEFISFVPEGWEPTLNITPGPYYAYSEPFEYFLIP